MSTLFDRNGGEDVSERFIQISQNTKQFGNSTFHLSKKENNDGTTFMDPPTSFRSTNLVCVLPENELQSIGAHPAVGGIEIFPNSAHLLLSFGTDKKIKLWELEGERRLIRTYEGHRLPVRCVAFNTLGTEFASSGFDSSLIIWDTETGDVLKSFPRFGAVTAMVYSRTALYFGFVDGRILELDTSTGSTKELPSHSSTVNSFLWLNNNTLLMSTSKDRTVQLIDVVTSEVKQKLSHQELDEILTTTKFKKENLLFGLTASSKIIRIKYENGILKIAANKTFKKIETQGKTCKISLSPDEKFLVCGDAKGHCSIWNVETRSQLIKWAAHSSPCVATIWHPHHTSLLLTAAHDGFVKLWI